ncbi:hypothetical protein PB2503_05177 [Parvularcula bermudensis HTCC2503]|uniref:Uncharacterized protein n=2 Tax=Parvularcula TaxID=208215 RepID=E0TFU5_PARBH|nr:hypothetical protein PB2503_05177 [Parvularcula bermudensis HTCC2503]
MIEWLEGSVYLLWRKQKIIEDASGAAIGTTAGNASAPGGYQLALPYSVGDEFELTFEYRVSDRAGFLKAWIDGQLVVDDDTGQFGYGLERETYLQAGVYAKEDGVTPITNFVHFPVEFSSRTADPSVYDSDAAPFRYDANHGSYMSAWNSDPQTDDFSLAASFYPDNFLTGPVTIDAVWSSSSSVEIIGYAQAFVFGNYPTDLGSTLPAVPVSRLKSCQVSIDWDLAEEAPVSNLVVLLEAFLTQTADATSTKVYEAAVWAALDTDGIYYHNNIATDAIGTFTDNLLDWVVRSARNKGFGGTIDYTIAIPDDGNPRKSLNFDFAAYLQWLVTQGELTGSEFFHGISFGPEFRKQLDLPQFVRGAASVEVDFDTGLISNGYFVRSLANVWAQGSERFYLHDGYCQVKGAPALAPLAQDPAFFTAPIGPGTIEVDWEILRNADPADTIRIKFRDEDGDHVGTTRSTVGQYTETIVLDKVATKFDVQAMTDDQDIDFIITDVRQVA